MFEVDNGIVYTHWEKRVFEVDNGTVYTHWEKHVFEVGIMVTSIHTGRNVCLR